MTSSRPQDPASARARSAPKLLFDRTFGPWFWGNVVSNSGNWLFNVTAAIVVFELSGSALLVGFVSVAQFAPLLLISPLAGAIGDRVDRRLLLLGSQSVKVVSAGVLAASVLMLGIDAFPGAWPVLAAALGIGVGQAVASPTMNALVPALVDDADLESGVALTSLTFNVGRALGPATAGTLLATLGVAMAFSVNAAAFVALIVALLTIRARPRDVTSDGDRTVRAGLRYVRREPGVLAMLVAVGATGWAADPTITLAPALADAVGGGATLVTVLVSAFGVAAAPAAVISGRLQRRLGSARVSATGATVAATGLLVAALAPVPLLAVAGFAATGSGFVLCMTGFTSLLQRRIPDELRGRVMALWSVAFLGSRPFAAVVHGGLSDVSGPRWALIPAIGASLLALTIALRLHRQRAAASAA